MVSTVEVTAIATGNSPYPDNILGADEFGYALTSAGTVLSWGYNVDGELGNGTFATSPTWSFTPSAVSGLTGVTAISAGADTGYAMLSGGTAWAWGGNDKDQLGNGANGAKSDVPVRMSQISGATAIFGDVEVVFALFPSR